MIERKQLTQTVYQNSRDACSKVDITKSPVKCCYTYVCKLVHSMYEFDFTQRLDLN